MKLNLEMTNTQFGVPTTEIMVTQPEPNVCWLEVKAHFEDKLSLEHATDVAAQYSKASGQIIESMMVYAKEHHPVYLLSSSSSFHLPDEVMKKYFRDFINSQLCAVLYFGIDQVPEHIHRTGGPLKGATKEWFTLRYLMGWVYQPNHLLKNRSIALAIERWYESSEISNEMHPLHSQIWYETDVISF